MLLRWLHDRCPDICRLGPAVGPDDVRDVLARSILADGLDFVLDIERSSGLLAGGRPHR